MTICNSLAAIHDRFKPSLREINAFTMNGAYEDPLMGAPSEASAEQLRDLHSKVVMPVKAVDEKKRA